MIRPNRSACDESQEFLKPSEIMRGAMQHVADGFCRGVLMDQEGHVCAQGGLVLAAGGEIHRGVRVQYELRKNYFSCTDAMIRLQELAVAQGYGSIGNFNDNTDQHQVLTLMEKAAISLEEEGL